MDTSSNPKKNQILHTSKELFWKFGFKRVTIEEICKEAGVSKMTFYKFFPNKLELAKTILDKIFDENIKNADWIITGEGKLDSQTLSGKTITGVLDSAIKESIPVAVFCGKIENESLDKLGITYADSVMRVANNLDDAMRNSYKYLKEISIKFSDKIKKV